jgi:putative aldouronate transport system permease protein
MKKSMSDRVFNALNTIFMALIMFTILFPFWDMLVVSFSSTETASTLSFNLWPKKWSFTSYQYCFADKKIYSAFFISVLRTVSGTLLHLVTICLAAYPLSKRKLPWRKAISVFFMIPWFFSGGMIPAYLMNRTYGLVDNFLIYILPGAFSFYVLMIVRNYIVSIDPELEESATIDGAGYWSILWRIIIPLSKPVLATVALWEMVSQWNAWFDCMIYIRNDRLIVMQYLLRKMTTQLEMLSSDMAAFALSSRNSSIQFTTETVKSAITIIVILPIICVYPFLQKFFVKGIMLGAVKG